MSRSHSAVEIEIHHIFVEAALMRPLISKHNWAALNQKVFNLKFPKKIVTERNTNSLWPIPALFRKKAPLHFYDQKTLFMLSIHQICINGSNSYLTATSHFLYLIENKTLREVLMLRSLLQSSFSIEAKEVIWWSKAKCSQVVRQSKTLNHWKTKMHVQIKGTKTGVFYLKSDTEYKKVPETQAIWH